MSEQLPPHPEVSRDQLDFLNNRIKLEVRYIDGEPYLCAIDTHDNHELTVSPIGKGGVTLGQNKAVMEDAMRALEQKLGLVSL